MTIIVLVFLLGQFPASGNAGDAETLRQLFKHFFSPIQLLNNDNPQNQAQVLLGKTLFYDPRLSQSKEYSCNGCHDLNKYGTNGDYFLQLKAENKASRDVPSIYNRAGLEIFGWTGQYQSLAAYINHALLNSKEMANSNLTQIVDRINNIKGYQPLIKNAFDTSLLTEPQISQALEAFLIGLVTPAPIDKFMQGDDSALTSEQLTGGLLFDRQYCHSCHTGTNFGGRMIQKMGVKERWPNQQDLGLYHDTKQSSHKMFFRVSTLRNVEKTAPYFHDGSSKRMWDAAKKMSRYELGIDMPINDALAIHTFFQALTGDIPVTYIEKPSMPN